uniref:Uncharacterized protein n=1 Tax=Anguilla anguilla TaxID=7936 RepID=A0A0E9S0N9_ANGAN
MKKCKYPQNKADSLHFNPMCTRTHTHLCLSLEVFLV